MKAAAFDDNERGCKIGRATRKEDQCDMTSQIRVVSQDGPSGLRVSGESGDCVEVRRWQRRLGRIKEAFEPGVDWRL